jgi:hypothetical protein
MKLDISYVLKGQYFTKTIQMRSLNKVLTTIEKAGASAITVTKAS